MHKLLLRISWLSVSILMLCLLAGCVSVDPRVMAAERPPQNATTYTTDLANAILNRDLSQLQAMMADPFLLVQLPGDAQSMPPASAMPYVEDALPEGASTVVIVAPEQIRNWMGDADPLAIWPEGVQPVSALGIGGLGPEGKDQAILVVTQMSNGEYNWYAMLYAPGGFAANPAPATVAILDEPTTAASSALLPTDVYEVLVLGTVGIFTAPNGQSMQVGLTSRGQTYRVLGVSPDGQWWAIDCPSAAGICWVSANPTFVRAVVLPKPVATATPRPIIAPTPIPLQPERITIPSGSTTAIRSNTLWAGVPQQFVFFAQAGWQVRLLLASNGNSANFSVTGLIDGIVYKPLASPLREFAFTSPRGQDYLLLLSSSNNTFYTLELSINRAAPTATPLWPTPIPAVERIQIPSGGDTAYRSGDLYANTPRQYVFYAFGGQTATIDFSTPSRAANFTVVGVSDGVIYKSERNPARNFTFFLPRSQDYLITLFSPVNTYFDLVLTIPPLFEPTPCPPEPQPTWRPPHPVPPWPPHPIPPAPVPTWPPTPIPPVPTWEPGPVPPGPIPTTDPAPIPPAPVPTDFPPPVPTWDAGPLPLDPVPTWDAGPLPIDPVPTWAPEPLPLDPVPTWAPGPPPLDPVPTWDAGSLPLDPGPLGPAPVPTSAPEGTYSSPVQPGVTDPSAPQPLPAMATPVVGAPCVPGGVAAPGIQPGDQILPPCPVEIPGFGMVVPSQGPTTP